VSTQVDVEEIEPTKSEKLLAVVLAVFLLIGGIWTYQKIDDWVAGPPPDASVETSLTPQDRAAIDRVQRAQSEVGRATAEQASARQNLELKREAYRTALDAGQPAGALERDYRLAADRLERAERDLAAARQELARAGPAAEVAFRHRAEALKERADRHELVAFLVRLGFVLAVVTTGYWLLGRLRNRHSRYLPAGLAFVGFAAILAFVMAADYITDYIDPIDLGPLILSLFGITLTLIAFGALQRYLAKRVPFRRVRRLECPFCGYPVRDNAHCEGCGRQVVAECATCHASRRVGTLRCGTCGSA
jgi:hypothetical protein